MKPEIKQRIEQINNGQVPDGFKKTTVGIVPLEWDECTIGDFLEFKNGLNKEKEAFGRGTPIVNYTDVWKKRGIRANDIKGRVELTAKEIETYEACEGDVFFTRTSETANEIGLSSVLLDNVDNAVFSGFLLRGRPYNDKVVKEYHQYCYSSNIMRHEIIRRSSMTTRALTSGPMLKQVKINLPSKDEQKKIAEILMKWDEAIELQEKYIECLEKKQNETVLRIITNVFGDKKRLSDCVNYFPSSLLVKDLIPSNDGYPVYGATGIATYIETYNFDCDAVSIIKYGTGAGRVNFLSGKHSVLGTMAEMLPKDGINIKYIYYLLKVFNFKKYIEISTTPNVYFEDYSKELFQIPNFQTQCKIVKELDTIEKMLNYQKDKFHLMIQQREALQQYLLNGIVRVSK